MEKNCEKICNIGERFAKIRVVFCENNNKKFAELTGIDPRSLSSICTGNRNPGKDVIERVLAAFQDINRAWLVLGEGEMLKSGVSQTNNGSVGGDMIASMKTERQESDQIDRLLDKMEDVVSKQSEQIDRLLTIVEQLTGKSKGDY